VREPRKMAMEVSITRTGGFFTAPARQVQFTAENLDGPERRKLERLVELSAQSAGGAQAPDAYRYTVTARGGTHESTVVVDEAAASPELRELLHWATSRATQNLA
jgi:hypothetical protein